MCVSVFEKYEGNCRDGATTIFYGLFTSSFLKQQLSNIAASRKAKANLLSLLEGDYSAPGFGGKIDEIKKDFLTDTKSFKMDKELYPYVTEDARGKLLSTLDDITKVINKFVHMDEPGLNIRSGVSQLT